MSESTGKAVFLSYASQDAEAAKRICEALRAAGLEVWFDADGGLEHGDEWDAKIRRQIKECVLFIPVISANTQARHEGYFRIEWDLAAERARGIASGVPFILPVVIDDTREPDALVPDRFRAVQWTKLPDGAVSPEVQARYLKLWSHRTGVLKHEAARSGNTSPGFASRPGFHVGRGLAAVVFTDVVGYSARMQRDETGTLALVKADFARMSERCAEHGGEILNSMGDGLLMCFSSAVQAVTCALQIQSEFGNRRGTVPPEQALEHRMGVHIGDVFRQETGGVAGDGVNIAARLEGKAPVGGVCISQMVHDTVKGKVPMQAVFIGPESFKNITEPIPIWHVAAEGDPTPTRPPFASAAKRSRSWKMPALAAMAVALVAAGGWFATRKTIAPAVPVAASVRDLKPESAPSATPRLGAKSIAVLPFDNLSEDKDANAFFADGMHEDIITNLLLIRELRCVPRTTAMTYRGTKKTNREIADELGVAYVLTATVRRADKKVRITSTLINARTDEPIWSKPYDKNITDIFAIQSELAQAIAGELKATLSPQEKKLVERRPTENTAAYDLFLQARMYRNAGVGRQKSEMLLQAAVALDPKFALAWSELSWIHGIFYHANVERTPDRSAKAKAAIDTAVRLAPNEPDVILNLGYYQYFCQRDYAGANEQFERVARIQSTAPAPIYARALIQWRQGKWAEALAGFRAAAQIDPGSRDYANQIESVERTGRRWVQVREARRRLTEIGLLNIRLPDEQVLAKLAFQEAGSTRQMEEVLARLPAEPQGASSAVRLSLALMRGDLVEVVRLSVPGPVFAAKGAFAYSDLGFTAVAALLAQGKVAEARARLEKVPATLYAKLELEPENAFLWSNLGRAEALLGHKAEALRCARKAVELVPESADAVDGPIYRSALAFVHAWTGDKDSALAEYARLLRAPTGSDLNVHEMRHHPWFFPLQGDPRFEALLSDPKNNAPLF